LFIVGLRILKEVAYGLEVESETFKCRS